MDYTMMLLFFAVFIYYAWLINKMKDMNEIKGYDVYNIKRRIIIIVTILSLYVVWNSVFMIVGFRDISEWSFFPVFFIIGLVINFAWVVYFMKNVYDFCKDIRTLQIEKNSKKKCNLVIAVILSIYMIPGYFYINYHLNDMHSF